MKIHKSFTLIELLVVIAVLAGMMALLVPNFMTVREKSRDVRRKSDLRGIQKAFELYSQTQTTRSYPTALPAPCQSLTDANGNVFIQKFPVDPLLTCITTAPRYYHATPNPPDPNRYTLAACLENKNDAEGAPCPTGYQGNTGGTACISDKCYILIEP